MSNAFRQNPMTIDTAFAVANIGTTLADPTTGSSAGPQVFKRIVWVKPALSATLLIVDINSNPLFQETAPVANQDVVLWDNAQTPYKFKQNGWAVTTISSGVLELYR